MVTFVCEQCNESLARSKIEGHVNQRCYQAAVSCIDCQTRFTGTAWRAHTTCVSEAVKYGMTTAKADPWVDAVSAVADGTFANSTISPQALAALTQCVNKVGPNCLPRKRVKFDNFAKNVMRGTRMEVLDEIWYEVKKAFEELSQAKKEAAAADRQLKQQAREAAVAAEPKSKRVKVAEEAPAQEDEDEEEKANWKKIKKFMDAQEEKRVKLSYISKSIDLKKGVIESILSKRTHRFRLFKDEDDKRVVEKL